MHINVLVRNPHPSPSPQPELRGPLILGLGIKRWEHELIHVVSVHARHRRTRRGPMSRGLRTSRDAAFPRGGGPFFRGEDCCARWLMARSSLDRLWCPLRRELAGLKVKYYLSSPVLVCPTTVNRENSSFLPRDPRQIADTSGGDTPEDKNAS